VPPGPSSGPVVVVMVASVVALVVVVVVFVVVVIAVVIVHQVPECQGPAAAPHEALHGLHGDKWPSVTHTRLVRSCKELLQR
jgi:hypothetical protein